MADVLISLDDNAEKTLRELARELHGGKKGSLSEAVADAVSHRYAELERTKTNKASLERLIRMMEKGYHFGKSYEPYKKRSELYESRFKDVY